MRRQMAFPPGTTLGPYEVISAAGAGGMGEVYRCRDTRLERTVAIKVLPQHLSSNAELKQRFEREARAISQLQHPHICVLHDVGAHNGTDYLVMEYLEGETLAERLRKRPLPVDQLLQIGMEIADALDKAHRSGIIHRDLKPANIMLTKSGAKLMDFGLARGLTATAAASAQSGMPSFTATPTMTNPVSPLTGEGSIVGTLNYMSPEQIEGKEADARSDIFAFGAVLYEMATGKRAFEGKSQISVASAILEKEPVSITVLQPTSPSALDAIIHTCLAKDPEERFSCIHDVKLQLRLMSARPTIELLIPGRDERRKRVFGLAFAVVIALCLWLSYAYWQLRPAPSAPIVRFSFGPPAWNYLMFRTGAVPVAISRDGTQVAFSAQQERNAQLYLRRMDRLETVPINGTENGDLPFFSPDGNWIGFFADHKLKKISLLGGGTAVTLCDAPVGRGGTWAPDDSIIFAPSQVSGLMRVSAAGGTPQPFTRLDSSKGETSHRWPQVLPGGREVVFATGLEFNEPILVANLKTGAVKTLPIRGGYPRYVPGGYLVFERLEGLFAVGFDLQSLEVTGSPFPVLQPLASTTLGVAAIAVSETGSLVFLPAGATVGSFAWVDRKSVMAPLGAPARAYLPAVRVSPDGQRIFVVMRNAGGLRDIWAYDISRGALTRLTFGEADFASPVVSWDGRRVAFLVWKPGSYGLAVKRTDGSGGEETILPGQKFIVAPTSWSPNGKFLAYWQAGQTGNMEVWVLPLEGERKPQPLLISNQFNQTNAVFSPDGKYVAYQSNESGHDEVYVTQFPAGGGKWQISTNGGIAPVWARHGKELFYRDSGDIMGVEVTTQPDFKASAPRVIVPAVAIKNLASGLQNFDVSPDGQRFLIHQQSADAGQSVQMQYVLNWNQELQRLAPANK